MVENRVAANLAVERTARFAVAGRAPFAGHLAAAGAIELRVQRLLALLATVCLVLATFCGASLLDSPATASPAVAPRSWSSATANPHGAPVTSFSASPGRRHLVLDVAA